MSCLVSLEDGRVGGGGHKGRHCRCFLVVCVLLFALEFCEKQFSE